MRVVWVVAVIVIAFVRGASADDKVEPKTDDAGSDRLVSESDAARFVAFFDAVVDAVVTNKDKCDRMADAIDKAIDSNREIIELINEARTTGKQLPASAQDRVRAGVAKMKPGMSTCAKSEKVHASFKRMDAIKKT